MANKINVYCDLETYNEEPISSGSHKYAETAEVLLFSYAVGDEAAKVLDFTEEGFCFEETELYRLLHDESVTTVWHNGSMFDRVVLRHALGIELPYNRIHDTMVQAYTHGLPGSLDMLCDIYKFGEDTAKMKSGKKLINLFCKPRPANMKLRRANRETHPEEWAEFVEYARMDIVSMRKLHKTMPMWNMKIQRELDLWYLDQKINDRGFETDIDLAKRAIEEVERSKGELNARVRELTDGEIVSATQRGSVLLWCIEQGEKGLPDLKAATLDKVLPTLPEGPIKEMLEIRKIVGSNSTSKYAKLLSAVSSDGRLRGTLQFAGAGRTSRWSGRVFQPQNLPRPSLKQSDIDFGIKALKAGCADILVDNVNALASSALRGVIVAPKGKKLVVSDLSNIEGRVAAWLAGETWKLEAFSAYDNGTGHDLYALAYAKSFGITPEEVMENKEHGDGSMRQIGKVQELALGYEGGVGAFLTFADNYNIDLEELADKAYDRIPATVKAEARKAWGWAITKKATRNLSERAYVTCDSLKRMWREAHPAISTYWKDIEGAAMAAVANPGEVFVAGKLKFYRKGAWLRMVLPSGRSVTYAQPHLKDGKLYYWGVHSESKKWMKLGTYGGKLFENACQAVARDVMGHNMPIIDEAGYRILLSVHDELITEAEDTEEFNDAELSALLANNPPWTTDLPLAAGGFEDYRYKKD